MAQKRNHGDGHPSFPVGGMTVFKFDKSVDSGPLPIDADVETREMIQQERIRRQIASHTYKQKG
jgi:hypothetical protein